MTVRIGKKGSWYSPEFRERAIILGREIGASHAGEKLGVECSLLSKLIQGKDLGMTVNKDDSASAESKSAALAAAKEIQKLRRENEELKKANFILKEVATFFSKDPLQFDSRRSLNSPNKGKKK